MRNFESGATRDSEEGKLDIEGFLSPLVLLRFSEYMHWHRKQADGKLRDADNWQKGIPEDAYMKSLTRHFFEVWRLWDEGTGGKVWEDALCAALFNIQGLLFESLRAGKGKSWTKDAVSVPASDPGAMGGGGRLANQTLGTEWVEFYKKAFSDSGTWSGLVPSKEEESK